MCRLVRIPQCNFNIFQGNTPSSLFLTFHLKPSSVATENNRKTKGNPWTFLQHFTNSYSVGCRLILALHKDHKYPLCGGGAVGHLLDPTPTFSGSTVPILLHPDLPVGWVQAFFLTHCRITFFFPIPRPSFLHRCDRISRLTQARKPQSQHLCPGKLS